MNVYYILQHILKVHTHRRSGVRTGDIQVSQTQLFRDSVILPLCSKNGNSSYLSSQRRADPCYKQRSREGCNEAQSPVPHLGWCRKASGESCSVPTVPTLIPCHLQHPVSWTKADTGCMATELSLVGSLRFTKQDKNISSQVRK